MTSLDELKQQVLATDLSVNNPKVQSIIESEIEKLVKCYEESKLDGAKFQFYGDVPDKIDFGNGEYTPQQILEHVRVKDEVGMYILKKIDDVVQTKWLNEIKPDLVDLVTEKNIDKMAVMVGGQSLTHRELLQKFITLEYDGIVRTAYQIELRKVYKPNSQTSPQPQKGLFEKVKNYLFG